MIPIIALPAFAAPASAPDPAIQIEALIQAVAKLEGATFIRNGSEHSPEEAADHLRLKWKKAGNRVKSVPDFIRACASESSLSGEPYTIRLKDGRTVLARDWFWTEWKRMQGVL